MARLDAPARALARAVAILGDDISVGMAAELSGLAPSAAESAADALAAAGVLADRRPLRFRHELLRGAVLAGMPAGEQASARAAAVKLLRDHHATAERIAAQLLHLEPRGEATAAATLREAAAQASARGAPASAGALPRRALEEPLEGEARAAALMELGAAEQRLGRPEAVERFIEAARTAPDPHGRLAAAVAAGHAAALDLARCSAVLRLLDDTYPPGGDRTLVVRAMNARLAAAWTTLAGSMPSRPKRRRSLRSQAPPRMDAGCSRTWHEPAWKEAGMQAR